jgi:uncharacterized protein YbcI
LNTIIRSPVTVLKSLWKLIKRTRSELVESGEQDLNDIIFKITGIKVMSFHSDLSTVTGERINTSYNRKTAHPNIWRCAV